MPNPGHSDELLIEAIRTRAEHATTAAAARALGIPRRTFSDTLAKAIELGFTACEAEQETSEEIIADLPDYQQVKKRLAGYNQKYIDDFFSSRHLNLRVPHKPFLQFFIGDLHRDSPGHDDDQFEADMGLIRRAQAEFTCHVVNIGDVLDNWPLGGRLGKKHHDSHLTRKEALSLVRGFMSEEGLDFVLHLLGNHDQWPGVDFEVLLRQWTSVPVVDWAAYLTVTTDKGFVFRTFAAHDMPGHSIHNSVHALTRRAKEEGKCDLYVAGHKHIGGQAKDQSGFRDKTYSFMRVRGYKRADEYAWVLGHEEQEEGCTGLAVVNPLARTQDGRCRTFYDLEEGVDWARFLTDRPA